MSAETPEPKTISLKDKALQQALAKRHQYKDKPAEMDQEDAIEEKGATEAAREIDAQDEELWEEEEQPEPTRRTRRAGTESTSQKNTEPFYIKVPKHLSDRIEQFIAQGGIPHIQDKTALGIAALSEYLDEAEKTQKKMLTMVKKMMAKK
ncbi:hypothetical protein [Geoalkalibacter halelectricus]|uniref:hypothetical protein n=1 Tax=Geoalkalibacter halelectricus TaxID=2847045 RepID=UPI003D1C5C35